MVRSEIYTFYKSGGEFFVRQKGGVSGDRIKNDPNFARTRENMSEFGHAGQIGKALRDGIRLLLDKASGRRLTSRLVAKLMEVLKTDLTNVRGERKVFSGNVSLLRGFEFNDQGQISGTLFAQVVYGVDRGTKEISASANLVPINDIRFPNGATHFKFTVGALVIDLVDTEQIEFVQANTGEIVIDSSNQAINLNVNYTIVDDEATIFQLALIEFFQEVNGVFYPLNNNSSNALKIVELDSPVLAV